MLYHYLLIIWRNIFRGTHHTLMNLFGLAISITAVLLISLFILSSLSADSQHTQADRIYRVGFHQVQPFPLRTALCSAPIGPALTKDYPEFLSYVRLMYPSQYTGNFLISHLEKSLFEDGLLFADTNFFDFFDYEFVHGSPEQALSEPSHIVLTEEKAEMFFGTTNPVGQILRINNSHSVTVSAVVRPHANPTHLRFHYLIPYYSMAEIIHPNFGSLNSFNSHNGYTYLMVNEGFDPATFVANNLEEFVGRYLVRESDADSPLDRVLLDFTPLRDIYFDTEVLSEIPNPDSVPHKSSKTRMLIFGVLAVFLSVIAVINYTNMAIARSINRSKEVGVRKVLGSSPRQLVGQYIGEAWVFVMLSLAVALILAEILIPGFNAIMGLNLSLALLFEPVNIFLLAGFVMVMSLISGSYPAFYMARIQPVLAIKGQFKVGGKTLGIKSILFAFQFFVSVFLVVCTLLVFHQFRFMGKKDMGFDSEHRVGFTLPDIQRITPEWIAVFKSDLMQKTGVESVSLARRTPLPGRLIETWSFPVEKQHGQEEAILRIGMIDPDFLDLFNIPVVDGRGFSAEYITDLREGVLLNETAVRDFGWENPVGKIIQRYERTYRVLGVVKDFHYFPLHQPIEPMMLLATNRGREVSVLLSAEQLADGLKAIDDTWKEFLPDYPLEYEFVDTQLAMTLSEEKKGASLLVIMTIFALIISFAGLFGLSAFTAEQRTREIAIRRTYGASLLHIVFVLSRGVGLLLGVSLFLAVLASYLYMSRWLENYAFRVELTPWPFLIAAGSAIVIAFTTSWVHAVRTAASNPVDKLRHQ